MLETSMFGGIGITMYYAAHNLPPFHAEYVGYKALVDIQRGCVIRGAAFTSFCWPPTNDMEAGIAEGLESGADDYTTEPFPLAALWFRANAWLVKLDDGAPIMRAGMEMSKEDDPIALFLGKGSAFPERLHETVKKVAEPLFCLFPLKI